MTNSLEQKILAYLNEAHEFDVFPPSKRLFQWKNGGNYQNILTVVTHYSFQVHIRKPRRSSFYKESVEPIVDQALGLIVDLKEIVKLTEILGHRPNTHTLRRLEKLSTDLTSLKPSIRTTVNEAAGKMELQMELIKGHAFADEAVDPLTGLKVMLYDALRFYTNLTVPNRLRHVNELLRHLDIADTEGVDPDSALDRLCRRRRNAVYDALQIQIARIDLWPTVQKKMEDIFKDLDRKKT
jgi:hypothetical protein